MAESDRQRLLSRALALPQAAPDDFFGGRTPPGDASPELLKRIDDTSLRTKLVDARIAQGLQSPKGPQKIASIVRIYPDFDAPSRTSGTGGSGGASNGRTRNAAASHARGLPRVEEMERLLARYREIEHDVSGELAQEIDARIAHLKRTLADLEGDDLEDAYHQLGEALERKRALASQVRFETFRRIERDTEFAERQFLRLLAR